MSAAALSVQRAELVALAIVRVPAAATLETVTAQAQATSAIAAATSETVAAPAVATLAIAAATSETVAAQAVAMSGIDRPSFRAEATVSAAAISRAAAEAAPSAAAPIDSAAPALAPAAAVARPALEGAAAGAAAGLVAVAADDRAVVVAAADDRAAAVVVHVVEVGDEPGKPTRIHEEHGHEDSVRQHGGLFVPDNRRSRCEGAKTGGNCRHSGYAATIQDV
jgi:hypothetical protein